MKNKFVYLLVSTLLLVGCVNKGLDFEIKNPQNNISEKVEENVKNVFGVSFDKSHTWCTTSSGEVTITDIPSGSKKVQVLALVNNDDETTSLLVLNESKIDGQTNVSLKYDIPSVNDGIFVSNGDVFKKVDGNNVSLKTNSSAKTFARRSLRTSSNLVIGSIIKSYANIRGWIDGEMLYGLSDDAYLNEAIPTEDYSDEYKTIFRKVIFSYFKNGKQYNNLPLITQSHYYNEEFYAVTTGGQPITVSPVYKSDKAKTYGNEVYNSDLYYYYFKDSDLKEYVSKGGNEVDYLVNLPKYKAIPFNQYFGETEDDNIEKRSSYTLIYWGDEKPTLGTEGTYDFPVGYKIGFMVRAKTTHDGGKKQGELYGDGRLNNHINFYGNFKSSNLGENGPRMGWIYLNGKMLLCCESGTDSDFNDIILEVSGGVEEITFIPEFENNKYTFCFEDRTIGDYDMNDVVIKAARIDETTIEYSIVACGAYDKLYIRNINGETINGNIEIHEMFNAQQTEFINTTKDKTYSPIVERVTVNKNFSFLDATTQPYIFDATTNSNIFLSKVGEDPHGIMIPYDFKYPLEKTCIKDAYPKFNEWGVDRVTSTNWYMYFNENLVW